jgi:hypothetical protein
MAPELQRWQQVAAASGRTLAELVREAVRIYARVLERESLAAPTVTRTATDVS